MKNNDTMKILPENDGWVLSRRDFVKASVGTGIALSLPLVNLGCGDDGLAGLGSNKDTTATSNNALPSSFTTETRTMHFDLSANHPDETYHLRVLGQKYLLYSHDDDSRQKLSEKHDFFSGIEPSKITHYVEDVLFPKNAVSLYTVTHSHSYDDRRPDPHPAKHVLAHFGIHVPESSRRKTRETYKLQGRKLMTQATLKAKSYKGLSAADDLSSSGLDAADMYGTYHDTALAIVFHHRELIALDPEYAQQILDQIANSPFIEALARKIYSLPNAYEYDPLYEDGWAILIPFKDDESKREPYLDDDKKPMYVPPTAPRMLDYEGNYLYQYILSNRMDQEVKDAVNDALAIVKNDLALKDIVWTNRPATPNVGANNEGGGTYFVKYQSSGVDHIKYLTGNGVSEHNSGFVSGVKMTVSLDNNAKRTITVSLRNSFLRCCSVYVQFLDADLKVIKPDTWTPKGPVGVAWFDSDTAKYLGLLSSKATALGIPIEDGVIDITFDMPKNASHAQIIYGSAGVLQPVTPKGDPEPPLFAMTQGAVMTGIFNMVIPAYLLATASTVETNQTLMKYTWAPMTLISLIPLIKGLYDIIDNSQNDPPAVAHSIGKFIGDVLHSGIDLIWACEPVRQYIIDRILAGQALRLSGPFGLAAQVTSMVINAAELAQTMGAFFLSRFIDVNKVSFTMDLTVTISRDPNDYQFPATATHYIIQLLFGEITNRVAKVDLPSTTVSEAQSYTFNDVPRGGKVKVVVGFLSNSGWLCGKAEKHDIANQPNTDGHTLKVDLVLEEFKVPLAANSIYHFKQKLGFAGGSHIWIGSDKTKQPEATRLTLQNGDGRNAISSLTNITINQKHGMLGYSWEGSGGIAACVDDSMTNISLNTAQNISLGQNPESGLEASCGYPDNALLVYDLLGELDGNHFLIDSSKGSLFDPKTGALSENAGYYLRRITLDQPFPKNPNSASGRFLLKPDAIAFDPAGVKLIAINRNKAKLMILSNPQETEERLCPQAETFCGRGNRIGLLSDPVGVAVAPNGYIYVLENGTKQIQAFTHEGLAYEEAFSDKLSNTGKSAVLALKNTSNVTYLDLAVEASGFIYVLYYLNAGEDPADYMMDIYNPKGKFLVTTEKVTAAKLTVDFWRNLYTLNYEKIIAHNDRVEPSVSGWIPPTPACQVDPNGYTVPGTCSPADSDLSY